MNKLVNSQHAPLGGQNDSQFKSARRNTLSTIRSPEDLQTRITELTGCEEMVMENTLGNLVSVLRCGGFEETVAQYVSRNCLILRISGDLLKYFLRLHTHIKYVSDNRGWPCAVIIKEYYAKKLLEVRNTYSTRLQVLCNHYILLRDSADKGFQSLRLQDTQLAALMTQMEAQSPPREKGGGVEGGGTGGSDGPKNDGAPSFGGCRYCGSSLHNGGKPECPWADLSHKAARAAARKVLKDLGSSGGGGGWRGQGGEEKEKGGKGGKGKGEGEEGKSGG